MYICHNLTLDIFAHVKKNKTNKPLYITVPVKGLDTGSHLREWEVASKLLTSIVPHLMKKTYHLEL